MQHFSGSDISFVLADWLVVPYLVAGGLVYAWICQRFIRRPPGGPRGGGRVLVFPTEVNTRERRKAA